MGDPAVDLVTSVPREINVAHPAEIRRGESRLELDVSFSDDGESAEGALVCLYKEDEFQLTERVPASGDVLFSMGSSLTQNGQVKLTVTGPGVIPYLATLNIAQPQTMLAVESYTIDDDDDGVNLGDGDDVANPRERLTLNTRIRNSGRQRPNGEMVARLSGFSGVVRAVVDSVSFNQAPAAGGFSTAAFIVDIDPAAPNDWVETMTVTVSAAGTDYLSTLSLPIEAPELSFSRVTWDGAAPAPSEEGSLRLRFVNAGPRPLGASSVSLISLSPVAAVTQGASSLPEIAAGANGTTGEWLGLNLATNYIPGNPVSLAAVVTDEQGTSDTAYFSIAIGEPSAADPFGPDGYGYYCIDDSDAGWLNRPSYNWIELNPRFGGEGSNLRLDDTEEEGDVSVAIDLPFEFRYYGETFDQLTVCSNGWAAFGDHHTLIGGRNRRIPSGETIPAMLSPFWDDLIKTANGGVFAYYDDDHDRFIVEWSLMRKLGPNGNGEPLETFELILLDPRFNLTPTGDGEIIFQYQDVTESLSCFQTWDTPFATVGIVSPDMKDGLEYTYWRQLHPGAAPLRDERAIKFTTATGIPMGHLAGRISDAATGSPLVGAIVHDQHGSSARTDGEGRYLLAANLFERTQTITFQKEFYNDSTIAQIELVAGDTATLDVALLKPTFLTNRASLDRTIDSEDAFRDSFIVRNSGNGWLTFDSRLQFPARGSRRDDDSWISYSPHEDTLLAGEEIVVLLEINPAGLDTGLYEVNLLFFHNASPGKTTIPIRLEVALEADGGEAGLPLETALLQNYPNPFNASTTIGYRLAQPGRVSLTLVDLRGREISRILEGFRGAGGHRLSFDGESLPAGVYLVRLEAHGLVQTRKIVLMK